MSLLLDTCAILFIAEKEDMTKEAVMALEVASVASAIFVSPLSALEIGRSNALGKLPLRCPPLQYYNEFVRKRGVTECAMSPEILVSSSFLPGRPHKDPMDRVLIATARQLGYTIVTSDREIIAYGRAGYAKVLECK